MTYLMEKIDHIICEHIEADLDQHLKSSMRQRQEWSEKIIKTVLREMDKEADEMKIEHKKLIVKLFVGVFAESHNIDIEGSRDMRSKDCA